MCGENRFEVIALVVMATFVLLGLLVTHAADILRAARCGQ
jgi:hypothetical protein